MQSNRNLQAILQLLSGLAGRMAAIEARTAVPPLLVAGSALKLASTGLAFVESKVRVRKSPEIGHVVAHAPFSRGIVTPTAKIIAPLVSLPNAQPHVAHGMHIPAAHAAVAHTPLFSPAVARIPASVAVQVAQWAAHSTPVPVSRPAQAMTAGAHITASAFCSISAPCPSVANPDSIPQLRGLPANCQYPPPGIWFELMNDFVEVNNLHLLSHFKHFPTRIALLQYNDLIEQFNLSITL